MYTCWPDLTLNIYVIIFRVSEENVENIVPRENYG